jgi:hypothetical protein
MAVNINLEGTAGATYDLDALSTTATRTDSSQALIVEIWYWNPDLDSTNPHSKPNPNNPEIGRIWLSKLVTDKTSTEYKTIAAYTA